jgi:serine/threonine-protein kinase
MRSAVIRVTHAKNLHTARFMAPEEFERGARIDERTTVFTIGRAALVFLSDATLSAGAFRGSRALFDVVARACSPDSAQRYGSLAAFYRAWRAARIG